MKVVIMLNFNFSMLKSVSWVFRGEAGNFRGVAGDFKDVTKDWSISVDVLLP